MLFSTRHANFRLVENYIYDPSARIMKNPLNSATFSTRQLNSATRQILHGIIVAYFDESSSQLSDASPQLPDPATSKMQL